MHIFLRSNQLAGETWKSMAAFPHRSSEIFYGWYREAAEGAGAMQARKPRARSVGGASAPKRDQFIKPLPGHFFPKIDPLGPLQWLPLTRSPERDPCEERSDETGSIHKAPAGAFISYFRSTGSKILRSKPEMNGGA